MRAAGIDPSPVRKSLCPAIDKVLIDRRAWTDGEGLESLKGSNIAVGMAPPRSS